MINFWAKTISFIFLICVLSVSCVANSAQAQNLNQEISWDLSNSELQITSPQGSGIEAGQDFYLRYLQNIKSFDATSKISWKVLNLDGDIVYQRETLSNLDKNEALKITKPGIYTINLKLRIDTNSIEVSKKLHIIPKDKEYYKGLELSEISLLKSQVELWNNSDNDIDASSLFLDFNATGGHQSLEKIKIIPARSFAIFELKPKLSPEKISLTFEKNLKQKTVESISQFDRIDLLKDPNSQNPDLSLQLNTNTRVWEWNKATFGQVNSTNFTQANQTQLAVSKIESKTSANFQQIETHRTGGLDQVNPIITIPFFLLFVLFRLSLGSQNEQSFDFKKNCDLLWVSFLLSPFWLSLKFAKIQSNWNSIKTEFSFYLLTHFIRFKAV